jgi:hypothetical protein
MMARQIATGEIIEGSPNPKPYRVERYRSGVWELVAEYATEAEVMAHPRSLGLNYQIFGPRRELLWPRPK